MLAAASKFNFAARRYLLAQHIGPYESFETFAPMNRFHLKHVLFFLIALSTAVFTSVCQDSSADDWWQFRGPSGQGTSQVTNMPTTWSLTENIRWQVAIEGKGWSSPVVSEGRIYVTTAVPVGEESIASEGKFSRRVETPYELRVLCLNAKTGELIWQTGVGSVPERVSIHPKNSHASATPIVTNDRLYVHFGIYATAALDLDGKVLWKREIKFKPVHGCGGSPVLSDDQLIFHCDGGDQAFVIALDSATGEQRWRTDRSVEARRKFSFATPLLIKTDVGETLVSPASDAVYGYDPSTGREKWHVRYPMKWSIVPRPVFANGVLLVCTGYESKAELLAIRPGGSGDVTDSHVVWREDRFVPYNPSPVVVSDKVFTVSDDGIACCRDLADGELVWKQRLGGNYSASPFVADGKIYFLSEDGVCTVIQVNDRYDELSINEIEERTLASMVPSDDGLLLRTASKLYCISSRP